MPGGEFVQMIPVSGEEPGGDTNFLRTSQTIFAEEQVGLSKEDKINVAIATAVALNYKYVFIAASMLPYNASAVIFNTAVWMVREGGSWDVHDARAYGAAGDNVTDDTVALQAALNATVATNAMAVVPTHAAGLSYLISDELIVPVQQRLRGLGRYCAVNIKAMPGFPAATPMIRLGAAGVNAFSIKLENFTINGDGNAEIGVYGERVGQMGGLFDCVVSNQTSKCIHMDTLCDHYILNNCVAALHSSAGAGAICVHLTGTGTTQRFMLDMCNIGATGTAQTGTGLKVDALDGVIRNVQIGRFNSGGIVVGDVTACRGLVLEGITSTQLANDVVRLGNTQNEDITIIGLTVEVAGAVLLRDVFNNFVMSTSEMEIGFYHIGQPDGAVANYPMVKVTTQTPAALTGGNNNNFALASVKTGLLRVSGDGGGTSVITGVAGGTHHREIEIINISANNVGITHNDAASTAANRILIPSGATVTLGQNDVARLRYDGITGAWRLMNAQL